MKRGEGVPPRETARVLREVDRELRTLTAAAAERTLRTASPGLGPGHESSWYRANFRMRIQRSPETEIDSTLGCDDHLCLCRDLAENWEELDAEGENLEWTYRRAGRWRVLESPGWNRAGPRRAWQYDYWRIEEQALDRNCRTG